MISFISPAMGFNEDVVPGTTKPMYLDKTLALKDVLKTKTPLEISKLMGCSLAIAEATCIRYNTFDKDLCALLALSGIAYKELDAKSLDKESFEFLGDHLIMCSGLYGALRPSDSITPYRLEMKTKLPIDTNKNLYEYWKDDLYNAISSKSNGVIVNLASKEYSKCVEKYLQDEVYVTCTFKVNKNNQLKVQSTAAKKARGAMVRWIATNKIDAWEDLMKFNEDNYTFIQDLSNTSSQVKELVFVKE